MRLKVPDDTLEAQFLLGNMTTPELEHLSKGLLLGVDPPQHELVGVLITIECPYKDGVEVALVIGYKEGKNPGEHLHKLWFTEERCVEEDVKLKESIWARNYAGVGKWDKTNLGGRRMVVKRNNKYHEAFVVDILDEETNMYELLYTKDNNSEKLDLKLHNNRFELLSSGQYTFKGEEIVTWSTLPNSP